MRHMPIPDYIHFLDRQDEIGRQLEGRKVFALVDAALLEVPFVEAVSPKVVISADEEIKTLATAETIMRRLMQMGADRDCTIVGIGGGITTDLAGFVAATYKRGVGCILIPTTLLAQTDAAIGGKNGVNVDGYKNIVGTFRQPDAVLICPRLASSTDMRINRCGIAEMLKTFLIADGEAYESAVAHLSRHRRPKAEMVRRAVEIKCDIVEKDPLEEGDRKLLNLGHTFGHAIEHCCAALPYEKRLMHGEAVAVGTAMAARMSHNLGLLDKETLERIESDFRRLHLPTTTDLPLESLIDAVARDKKASGGKVDFILIDAAGHALRRRMTLQEISAAL